MNLKYQITPTFKGGTEISYTVVQSLSLLHSFAIYSQNPGSVHCRFVQIFGLKVFNLFRLLRNETLKMFSIRERRKSRHEFGGTEVCKAD